MVLIMLTILIKLNSCLVNKIIIFYYQQLIQPLIYIIYIVLFIIKGFTLGFDTQTVVVIS